MTKLERLKAVARHLVPGDNGTPGQISSSVRRYQPEPFRDWRPSRSSIRIAVSRPAGLPVMRDTTSATRRQCTGGQAGASRTGQSRPDRTGEPPTDPAAVVADECLGAGATFHAQ